MDKRGLSVNWTPGTGPSGPVTDKCGLSVASTGGYNRSKSRIIQEDTQMKIAVAGAGYVGLSNAVLLAQYNQVTVVDVIKEKINLINQSKSPIVDKEMKEYLSTKELSLQATLDA